MGAAQSNINRKNESDLFNFVDSIAANYIVNLSINDMGKLLNESECKNIEVLTKKVFEKKVNFKDLTYLKQRIKDGNISEIIASDNLAYIHHSNDEKLSAKEKRTRNNYCKAIAQFYIKVAHLYSSIARTIDANYEDEGTKRKVNLFDLYGIKTYSSPESKPETYKVSSYEGFCDRRINMLMKLLPQVTSPMLGGDVNINVQNEPMKEEPMEEPKPEVAPVLPPVMEEPKPEVAPVIPPVIPTTETTLDSLQNITIPDISTSNEEVCSMKGNLGDDEGFKTLDDLFKDVFTYSKRGKVDNEDSKFKTEYKPQYVMSKESKEEYKQILDKFYKTFTGNEPSEELKSFSDVPLSDFSKQPICDGVKVEPDNINEKLFIDFANQIKEMLQNTNDKYQSLLKILKEMFTIEDDKVYIHPDLNSDKLNDLGKKTRSVIVNLYIDCEKDYRKGVEEYNKIKENLQNKNGKKLEDQIGNTIEKEMTII